jgi:hypothetical protein
MRMVPRAGRHPTPATAGCCYWCDSASLAVVTFADIPPDAMLLPRSHPDGERDPARGGGQWVVRGSRVPVQALLDNAGGRLHRRGDRQRDFRVAA